MIETKAMIIHQILKLDKPFKPRHIYEEIGLSAQNTNNHLSRLVSKGILIKAGPTYMVANKELLIDELVAANERGKMEPATETPFGFPFPDFQKFIDAVARARVLEKERAIEAHIYANAQLDVLMEETKKLKKWLNNKSYTMGRAKSGFDPVMYQVVLNLMDKSE